MKSSIIVPAQIRSYRAKIWIRSVAVFFLAFSLAFLIGSWGAMLTGTRPPNTIEFLAPGLMVVAGIITVGYYFTTRVTLFPHAIEIQTLWSTKRMDFNRIRGRRDFERTDSDGNKTQYIKLEPLDYQQPAIEFQDVYNFDNEFYEWLRSLPKLG